MTSRPYADIERGFYWGSAEGTEATCISLRGENESDQISKEIDIVIDDQLPRIASARRPRLDPEVLSRLTIHLKMTPHRIYLCLHLIFDIIRKSLDSTVPCLERLVNTLPRTVEEAYEKILNRSIHKKSVIRLLHMVVGAVRPLTLRELNIACSIDELLESGESCHRYSDLDLETEDAFRAKARNVCGLFVIIVDSKIYLIHQTAKEFLLSQTSNDLAEVSQCDSDVWKHSLNQFDSHFIMLKICLSYLLLRELEHPVLLRESKDGWPDSQPELADSAPTYLLLNYAALAWITHFQKCRSRDTALLLQWALDVCDTQSNRFQRWYHLHESECEFKVWSIPRYSRGLNRLTVASYFGLRPIVEVLLKGNGIDLNPRDESGDTPLGWAAYHGDLETVKLVAEQDDIDVNAGDTTPLYWAAKENHLEIVKVLVEKDGTDLNRKSGGSNALDYAMMARHLEIAKLLINKDSIDKKCFYLGDGDEKMPELSWDEEPTHLMLWAIDHGYLEIVELFIERKAFGINQKDRDGRTPLVMAIQAQRPAVVRLLVGKEGIDLNLKGPKGRMPLAWAARKGNAEIVNIILKKDGIEVNSKDAAGETPLAIARSFYSPGSGDIVKLLVEHNASDSSAP